MKKLLLIFFSLPCFLVSCKKTNSDLTVSEKTSNLTDRISVSKTGFLVFKNTATVVEYCKVLKTPQGKDVLNSLISKGFKSRDVQVQKGNLSNVGNDGEDIYSQYFSSTNFLQVANVILRISDDHKKLLTAKENVVSSAVMSAMEAGIFDAQTMNKLNVERAENQSFDLVEYSNTHPNGVVETEQSLMGRPIFGKKCNPSTGNYGSPFYNTGSGNCQQTICTVDHCKSYIFWICVDDWYSDPYDCTNVASEDC